ncbi:hypothetical protein [uncultured Roseibium sp.]|uniref:DUF6963 family protein n=1 Tax=uncultured Roseibium sp. TaxID=1936171 RepID=UPI002605BFFF|nr:hypothetical protein [uncultured Roseibium sp.]
MTVGIAATGPNAGAGVLAGLRAIEAVGHGAIGGFVSFAVLSEDQQLSRSETQTGGSSGLLQKDFPENMLGAPFAALISSGPNRPVPLAQFIAAQPGVGLVTGHRFPQIPAGDGIPLNAHVLAAMERGQSPQMAIADVIDRFPDHDAGFVALSLDGTIAAGNMPAVLLRRDHGCATRTLKNPPVSVATIHNAIHPSRVLADMINDVVLEEMLRPPAAEHWITASQGIRLSKGERAEVHINHDDTVVQMLHPQAMLHSDPVPFGLGDQVRIMHNGNSVGWLGYEPFMIVKDGVIVSMDGKPRLELPVFRDPGFNW